MSKMWHIPSSGSRLSWMQIKNLSINKLFLFASACLLIVGTSIGAGMLGIPVVMGQGGAIPNSFFLFLTWIASLVTGLLFLEVMSYVQRDMNFASLAEKFISPKAKPIIVAVYLLLFLSLLFAYIKGGGMFISDISRRIPTWLGSFLFISIFFPFLIKGTKIIGRINGLLIFPMTISFILLLSIGAKEINLENLAYENWNKSYLSSPILVTSYGFHIIIPSLYILLNKNKNLTRWAIVIGTIITFLVYLLWNVYIMGVVPLSGEISLMTALQLDQTAITPLKKILGSTTVSKFAQIFHFCALTTSFLGVSLATIDFSMDALRIEKSKRNRTLISFFIFVPALILSATELRIFYLSLNYGAALACVLLLIIFPAFLMKKIIPKLSQKRSPEHLRFLKKSYYFAFLFGCSVILAQILSFT